MASINKAERSCGTAGPGRGRSILVGCVNKDAACGQKERQHSQKKPLTGMERIGPFIGHSQTAAGTGWLPACAAISWSRGLFLFVRHLSLAGYCECHFLFGSNVLGNEKVHAFELRIRVRSGKGRCHWRQT